MYTFVLLPDALTQTLGAWPWPTNKNRDRLTELASVYKHIRTDSRLTHSFHIKVCQKLLLNPRDALGSVQ